MMFNRVLIEPDKEKSVSGLEVVRDNQPTPDSGTVLAVGPGKVTSEGVVIPVTVKPGDHVRFVQFSFDEWKKDGVVYLITEENNILLIDNETAK